MICRPPMKGIFVTETNFGDVAAQQAVIDQVYADLLESAPLLTELGRIFADAGFELALVGGPVRDAIMGRLDAAVTDLDLTTNARPDETKALIESWLDAIWEMGREYGTIGGRKDGRTVEITTYRTESYDPSSRKPSVEFGDDLKGDLSRRDFTVNSMALSLPDGVLVDPYGGFQDLLKKQLRTPSGATQSFDDDPLRMMRAARFVSQLGFAVDDDIRTAMKEQADRISIVSVERVQVELTKLMVGNSPSDGLRLMVDTGLCDHVLPEVPKMKLTEDEHRKHKDVYEHSLQVLNQAIALEDGPEGEVPGPDFILRFAALMHDIGKPRTRKFTDDGRVTFHHHEVVGGKMTKKRMKALRFDTATTKAVVRLVDLHLRFHGYGKGEWTDAAVRRYVTDAGDQLQRLHKLTRADCTTRNKRKAARLAATYDHLEERISVLAEKEELAAIRPDLDGGQIMRLLDLPPGPLVGRAYKYLLALRIENGPMETDVAEKALREWWVDQPENPVNVVTDSETVTDENVGASVDSGSVGDSSVGSSCAAEPEADLA